MPRCVRAISLYSTLLLSSLRLLSASSSIFAGPIFQICSVNLSRGRHPEKSGVSIHGNANRLSSNIYNQSYDLSICFLWKAHAVIYSLLYLAVAIKVVSCSRWKTLLCLCVTWFWIRLRSEGLLVVEGQFFIFGYHLGHSVR